jgi:hypothetical protein
LPVQLKDLVVVFSDNEQRGSPNVRQGRTRQVGTAASRDDRTYPIGAHRRSHQRSSGAGAGTEVADPKVLGIGELGEPVGRVDEPFGEQLDVEAQLCRAHFD